MNDWGKKWDSTPSFKYKGKGIYEATTTLKKGRYEFKIAPIDWSFDYGANLKQENVIIGQKTPLEKEAGSSNLIMDIEDESTLTFRLEVTKDSALTLYILEN